MIRTNLKIAATALAVASAFASTAYAAGFQLTEQSALALGRAYAGVGVDGTDVSGMYYNPATMTLHPGTQVQLGAVGVGLNLEYVGHDAEYKENGRAKEEVLPHGYISHQINDTTWVGLAITIPYGLATEYDSNWKHQELGTDAKITVINFNPNVAWKATDTLSFGAGLALQYVDAKFGVGVAKDKLGLGSIHNEYTADGFTWGFNLGMMWAPVENVRFGVSYRSETKHKTNGTLKTRGTDNLAGLSGDYDASVTVSGPAWAMFNAAWDVNDYLSLYATFRWADWSSFKSLKTDAPELSSNVVGTLGALGKNGILNEGQIKSLSAVFNNLANIENNWVDTYLYSVGYDLRVNSFWTLRGGVAYETSAIGDPKTRTALIPDADRWWFAIGSSFHWTKDFQTDIGFAHLHGVHERSLYDHTPGGNSEQIGKFRHLDAYLLGVQMQYRF
ncbi:outer membrane protein transport protein [uncultured Sutterella sp.]|uniref:OmpP1/FadL family transporter n=1 Tax=uncultured Sutterella sp. TaxID=286133 RepID=UPI00260CE6E8|nr:outer membrane protein transport protein [uncultured Sutterella sp.]